MIAAAYLFMALGGRQIKGDGGLFCVERKPRDVPADKNADFSFKIKIALKCFRTVKVQRLDNSIPFIRN